jgi:hypothetical protein
MAAGSVAGLALTASAASDVVGHVYVDDNTAGVNTIGAFDRHSDGSLIPMAGHHSQRAVRGAGRSSALKVRFS